MNRRQKIIVSITGIFIVLLALVGLTYAYFLTRITGNSNPTSISVTTANLELVYGDGTTTILEPDTALIPSSTEVGTKDFTVTNNGENTSYTVLIEDTVTKYATAGSYKDEDGSIVSYTANQPTEFESNDFRYTLSCKKYNKAEYTADSETAVATGDCDGISEQKMFPIDGGVMVSNNILSTEVHVYELKFWYIDTGENQSKDMNKTYNAKVNIVDIRENNPYAVGEESVYEKSLAYNIINNALLKTNGTELVNTTPTKAVNQISSFKYVKAADPTTFTSSRSSATNYYITYSDDYTINESDGNFTLVNKDGSTPITVKYTGADMAETLKGKYAYWNKNQDTAKNVTNISSIYKISTTASDIAASTIKYSSIQKGQESTEKVLSATQDNLGTTYYYRGGVQDNYVLFNNMCFRIVRIEGDGSVKLTLAGEIEAGATNCNGVTDTSAIINNGSGVTYGYKTTTGLDGNDWYMADYENDGKTSTNTTGNSNTSLKESLDAWFDSKFKNEGVLTAAGNKVKNDEWCLGGNYNYKYDETTGALMSDADLAAQYAAREEEGYAYYSWRYSSGKRIYGTTKYTDLTCGETEDVIESRVGSITADEVALAGGASSINYTYYLYENAKEMYYWTLSRARFGSDIDDAFYVSGDGRLDYYSVDFNYPAVRPSVTLVTNTQITKGTGIKGDPYIINVG